MSLFASRRAGVATADIVMGVALVALLLAAVAPTLRARSHDALVERAERDVETLRVASEQYFASNSAWPTPGEPGAIPAEVASAFPGRATLAENEYSLQWRVLEMLEEQDAAPGFNPTPADADAAPDSVGAERVRVPVEIGSVLLRSSDDELLAALLARYGAEASFVRDSTWTLVVGVTSGG